LTKRSTADAPGALDVALRFLATRPRSEAEVRRRLARRTRGRESAFAADEIESTLVSLRGAGLVDDAAFAAYWVDQRRTFRPRGVRLLKAELRARGVSSETAAAAAVNHDDDAYRAASNRARQLAAVDDALFKTRMAHFLARRGFDWDRITPTVDRLLRERTLSTS
jgi:regulatory protein